MALCLVIDKHLATKQIMLNYFKKTWEFRFIKTKNSINQRMAHIRGVCRGIDGYLPKLCNTQRYRYIFIGITHKIYYLTNKKRDKV